MSVNLMSAIFETEFFDLKDEDGNVTKASTAKLVLLAMADHANDEGEGIYPSVERLCRKTSLSEQTIRNTLDALKFNGIVFLAGKSKYGTNNHTINTTSFPRALGKEVTVLTLQPLDPLTGNVGGSNRSPQVTLPVRPESLTTNKPSIELKGIEAAIFADRPVTQEDMPQNLEKEMTNAFESAFRITRPWDWYPDKPGVKAQWNEFRSYLLTLYEKDKDCFSKYFTWSQQPYVRGAMSALSIKKNPQDFPTSWACFCASAMYTEKPKNFVEETKKKIESEDWRKRA